MGKFTKFELLFEKNQLFVINTEKLPVCIEYTETGL